MQVDHRFLPNTLKQSKCKLAITEHKPLLLIISTDFSFISTFAQTILQYHNYPFQVHHSHGHTLMDRTLPLLVFQNVILSQEALMQFLCDVAFCHLDTADQFITRKENLRRVYRAWLDIFNQRQRLGKHDHSTSVYQELMLFSRGVANRGYQRIFPSYDPEGFNPQAILMIDITKTILQHCPRETQDFLLRGGFPQILDFHPQYIEEHIRRKQQQDLDHRMEGPDTVFVLLEEKAKEEVELPRKSLNLKWFSGVLVGLAFIFGKWAH